MKKYILISLILILAFPSILHAKTIEIGIFYGKRMVNDTKIHNTYGHGSIYSPYLAVNIFRMLSICIDYESGYSKKSKIGIYEENSSLKVKGLDVSLKYELIIKKITPYFKLGVGFYSYEQNIISPHLSGYDFAESKTTINVAFGIKFYINKIIFFVSEVKYVPLKVKPYEEEVDLGGSRLLVGIGISI